MSDAEVLSALDEIVLGRNVRRTRHALAVDGRDWTEAFRGRLAAHGFAPMRVREVAIAVDERVPAFLIEPGTATFGYVFWEKFTDIKKRKLFGSTLRNAQGDWAVILGVGTQTELWVQSGWKEKVDPDRPAEF